MHPFIETVKESLGTMVKIRAMYINNEDELLRNCDDYRIHNRIFEIYSRDTPETLVLILYKLKIIEEEEAYGQHNVNSVLLNFCRYETALEIMDAYYDYYKQENVHVLVEKLVQLTAEMQDCMNNLQLVA